MNSKVPRSPQEWRETKARTTRAVCLSRLLKPRRHLAVDIFYSGICSSAPPHQELSRHHVEDGEGPLDYNRD